MGRRCGPRVVYIEPDSCSITVATSKQAKEATGAVALQIQQRRTTPACRDARRAPYTVSNDGALVLDAYYS